MMSSHSKLSMSSRGALFEPAESSLASHVSNLESNSINRKAKQREGHLPLISEGFAIRETMVFGTPFATVGIVIARQISSPIFVNSSARSQIST